MSLNVLNNTPHADVVANPPVEAPDGKKIGRIEVDRELCIGAESCVVVAPDVYYMDDENIAVVKDPKGADYDTILQSAQACPVAAVILYDDTGNQVYP